MREKVLSLRSSLRASRVSVCEDYCPETRLARRKLIEFGKTQSSVFQLRYNKLIVNKKCYVYDASVDSVHETALTYSTPVTSNLTTPVSCESVHSEGVVHSGGAAAERIARSGVTINPDDSL